MADWIGWHCTSPRPGHTRLSALAFCFSFMILSSALAAPPPSPSGSWAETAETVFSSDSAGCSKLDIPDSPARAFRDARGQVHLFATHSVARAMVGPSLDEVRHDCRVVYRSPEDADPSHFDDRNWLASFFTTDGKAVVSLVHSEYEAWNHPGRCLSALRSLSDRTSCWWNAITMALSRDGGFSFVEPAPPANLVASVPYRFDGANKVGSVGYFEPTNIVQSGTAYYAIVRTTNFKAQRFGACLIRTMNLLDPASWRAWDGSGFNVRFVNPYRPHGGPEADHVCEPLGGHAIYAPSSLSYVPNLRRFISVEFTPDARFGPPGLYMAASDDLIHWSKPNLIASTESIIADEGGGRWHYGYFSMLDPTATDRNFQTVSDTPYIYYVRIDLARGNLSRALMRRRVRLHFDRG